MVTNLDNYSDWAHYSADINSRLLRDMQAGEHRLTRETCKDYWQAVEKFYTAFDYEGYFAELYEK